MFCHVIPLQDRECGDLILITAKSSIYSTKPCCFVRQHGAILSDFFSPFHMGKALGCIWEFSSIEQEKQGLVNTDLDIKYIFRWRILHLRAVRECSKISNVYKTAPCTRR
ncbi:hypothetical protein CRX72_02465 [Pantoea sp. BRM17]|nr:hypothetical protein CRX72_02465 [Pantoea sp. BRM17]